MSIREELLREMNDAELDELTDRFDDDLDGMDDLYDDTLAERQRRETERENERARKRAAAVAYAKSPKGKLAALRKELKAEQAKLDEMPSLDRGPRIHPDQMRDSDPINDSRYEQAQVVTKLQEAIATAEARLPFHEKSDDTLVSDAALFEEAVEANRERVAKADRQLKDQGIADTSFGVQKARKQLAAANEGLASIAKELGTRKADARTQATIDQMAAKRAVRMRQEKLAGWEAEATRLRAQLESDVKAGESGRLNIEPLQTAEKNVTILREGIANNVPLHASEIADAKEAVAADSRLKVLPDGSVEGVW